MKRLTKLLIIFTLAVVLLPGCASFKSSVKDFSSEIIGLKRTFNVYDDDGNITMSVTGKNTNLSSSKVSGVIMIEVDGSRWQHVGSTLIAYESNLDNLIDNYSNAIVANGNNEGSITSIDKALNDFAADIKGLERIIIIKTQTGKPIAVFEGDNVLIEESELENTTKILIDGKRMHVYRADLEIIETSLIED